jgi:hypothetical protein
MKRQWLMLAVMGAGSLALAAVGRNELFHVPDFRALPPPAFELAERLGFPQTAFFLMVFSS